MDNTIIQQGIFTGTGGDVFLNLRAGTTWMSVINYTVAGANVGNATAVQWYWQLGMGLGESIGYAKSDAASADNLIFVATNSIYLYDTSLNPAGALNATITAISAAAIPVVTTNPAHGLVAGNVVRLINVTGAQQLGGFDFTVGYNTLTATTFSLDYMSQIVAGTNGSWRKINYDPLFYPRRRTITKITRAAQAVVTLSVTHGYEVGQLVRMVVPRAYGMTEMNGLLGTIVAVNTTTTTGNSITLDIDSTAFTAFAFPLTAAVPFTAAEVVPVGMDTAEALVPPVVDILSDATVNTGELGIRLVGGAEKPAGDAADIILWRAGTSFSVLNT